MEFLFECSTALMNGVIKLNTKTEVPYLQATMHYFVYYKNTLLTTRSRLYIRLKHTKEYRNFWCEETVFLLQIPIEHSGLYDKIIFLRR